MRSLRNLWSLKAAVFAALLLVVQLAAGGLANAGQVPLDAFGNPICIGSGEDLPHGNDGAGHVSTDCCAWGCVKALDGAAPLPRDVASVETTAFSQNVRPAELITLPRANRFETPGAPRAPPAKI